MKKIINYLLLSFILILTLVIVYPLNTFADTNGGELKTEGVISFYEDEPSSTTESSSVSKPQKSGSKTMKPAGRLPQTGEMAKTSLAFTGVAIVVIGLLLFLWKHKKENEGQDNR